MFTLGGVDTVMQYIYRHLVDMSAQGSKLRLTGYQYDQKLSTGS